MHFHDAAAAYANPRMTFEVELTLMDRLAFSAVGAVAGFVYGVAIAVAVFFATGEFHGSFIVLSIAVFAAISFFYDNFGFNAFLALIHFVTGVANGVNANDDLLEKKSGPGYLHTALLFGFAFGTILVFGSWFDF
ncbi:MAG: hypothetical protein ACM3SV_13360 [Betaproteobacteria bacterium]